MDNTDTKDYCSEKVYDGLVAGCVPIYLGTPKIHDFIPHDSPILDYGQLRSPKRLLQELERLAGDKVAYEEKLAWKRWDSSKWNAGGLPQR